MHKKKLVGFSESLKDSFHFRIIFYGDQEEEKLFNTPPTSLNRVGFLSSMTNVIHANMRNKNSFAHVVCREHLFTVNVVMYFPKDFYLLKAVNKCIGRLLSSGIMSHIINKYVDLRYWNVKEPSTGPQVLNFRHLRGAFVLWAALCFFSTFAFIIELMVFAVKG